MDRQSLARCNVSKIRFGNRQASMNSKSKPVFPGIFASLFAIILPAIPYAAAQGTGTTVKPSGQVAPSSPSTVSSSTPVRRPVSMSPRAIEHYQLIWGVENLDVKAVESGQMIRFSYTVLDPVKAAILNDKKVNPSLIDEQARVRLEIPTMEKVGQLRQSSTPEVGKSYWMVFSNKGGIVKPGDRVSVIIGRFKADGLYVR
jgi:hypothetical protein